MIQTITRWVLAGVGPIALLVPKGMYIPLVIVSVLGIFEHKFKEVRHLVTPLWLSLFGFVLWMGLSCVWSINPRISLLTLKKVLPILACAPLFFLYFKSLSHLELDRHLSYFFRGIWVCVGILVVDYFMDYPLIDIVHTNRSATYSRFITTVCLGIWLFELTQRYPKYPVVFILLSIVTSAWVMWPYDFDAGPVALLLGCLVVILTMMLPKLTNRFLSMVVGLVPTCLAFLIGFLMTSDHWQKIAVHPQSSSSQQRLEMIDWASKKFIKTPVFGSGVGQTPELSIISPVRNYVTRDGEFQAITIFESGIQHLHNGLLQILLELGIVGSLLLGLFVFFAVRQGFQCIPDNRSLALMHGYVTSLLFIVSVSFGVWQIWWLSVIIMITVMFSLRVSDERPNSVTSN